MSTNDKKSNEQCAIHGVVDSAVSLTQSQIEHQIEMDYEEDFMWMDDDEILGYECMDCGNLQDNESGFGCDVCTGHSLEAWYG